MNKDLEIRRIALETLLLSEKSNIPSHILIRDVLDKYDYLERSEKALISTMIKGVIERKTELDYVIDQFSSTKHTKMKNVIRIILEIGTYQILYMESYDTLAVNMAVNLAKKKGFASLAGFVNAVLRKISKEKANIRYPDKNDENYLSVKYSVSDVIVDLLKEQYDLDTLEKVFAASLNDDYVRIRIKEGLSEDEYKKIIKEIKDNGAEITESVDFPNLIKVKGLGNITRMRSFNEGLITVQDAGSYILCKNVPKGETILDACSAPGGKSIFLSELYPDSQITSCDISEDKISKIEENIARMKTGNITTKIADATIFNPEWEEKFDTVLADVPCSGLGVIGKKQDIKYRITEEGLNDLYELQKKIILNVSKYVKKGGYLVYSTCTINRKENEDAIKEFMSTSKFSLTDLTFTPNSLHNSSDRTNSEETKTETNGYMTLLQGINDTDGFFIAVLKREQ